MGLGARITQWLGFLPWNQIVMGLIIGNRQSCLRKVDGGFKLLI